jgi:general secretion pathway protein B
LPATAAAPDNIRAAAPAVAASPDAKPVQAYYELPFPVRKDLPAIKISMHVYAVDPAQRFIVVNNVHQGEGDSIEGGVIVREIRPTDIVLEFQGKIFSVPRTGI